MDPAQLKFARTHEWVSLQGDVATVGISDFAVKELTDVVHIELPKPGKKVSAGDVIGEIESVKAVSDLYAPLGGEIIEVNRSLEGDLGQLSDSPFGEGWIVKLKATNPAEAEQLLSYQDYQQQCEAH